MAVFAAFAFTNAVQGWFLIKNKWYEIPLFLISSLILFYPAVLTSVLNIDHSQRYFMYFIGLAVYLLAWISQKLRLK